MIPHVFLSLSAADDAFVSDVYSQMPLGLAFFYRRSFDTGADLLGEMEKGVGGARIFALFASEESLDSDWVKFEINEARFQTIQNPKFRVFVYPTSPTISASQLPPWMKRCWVGDVGRSAKDIARHLRHSLSDPDLAVPGLVDRPIGRGALVDFATRTIFGRATQEGHTPNVLIFTGISGIGRRTACKEVLRHVFPGQPGLSRGPELRLPPQSDLAELYRGLRSEIEPRFNAAAFMPEWEAFVDSPEADQIEEAARNLNYFGNLGQAVIANLGSGLFHDDGTVKGWVLSLFGRLSNTPTALLCLISNRQISETVVRRFPNVVQVNADPLSDGDIGAVITSTAVQYGLGHLGFPEDISRAIGGHPGVAKSAVRLVKQLGMSVLSKSPHLLFKIQDEVLAENLRPGGLSEIQTRVLSILSWVPALGGQTLFEVISGRLGTAEDEFVIAMQDLILSCLVQVSDEEYLISSAVRYAFRRQYGYGDRELLQSFSEELHEKWQAAKDRSGLMSLNLLDSFVYMHALEGKALPEELRRLLPAAVLLEVVRDMYNRGRDDQDLYGRVIAWGGIAEQMRCPEDVREEILGFVLRAHARRREFDEVRRLIAIVKKHNYRSRFF